MTEARRLQLLAVIAMARADVAACGFALPRARILQPGLAPIDLCADATRPAGMSAGTADDWFLAQLVGGRERIAECLAAYRRSALSELCECATMLITFMGELPRSLLRKGEALGCHVEAWDETPRRVELAVLPYRVIDDVPQLGKAIPAAPAAHIRTARAN